MSSSLSNPSSSGITPGSEECSSPSTTATHVSQTQLGPQHTDDNEQEKEKEGKDDNNLVNGMDPFVFDPMPTQNGYLSEESADVAFQKELEDHLNAFLLQYRIWSTTRPEIEFQLTMDALSVKYEEIIRRQHEQEKTRQNYADLLQQVRRLFDTMASTS